MRRLIVALAPAALVLAAGLPLAQATGGSSDRRRSYETRRLNMALAIARLVRDPNPEGKRIVFVKIVRRPVFADDEIVPTWLNALHWLTDADVVEREVLLHVGEPYDSELAEESARILRDLGVLSLVRVVPVRVKRAGSGLPETGPEEVGVVVFTRDLWSLRLENSFQFTGGGFDRLNLQLTERNLFGRNKRATVRYFLFPLTWRLGQVYVDRRLFGGDLALTEAGDLIFNRASGQPEGVAASLSLGQPLYDLAAPWGWGLQSSVDLRPIRQARGAEIIPYDLLATPDVEEALPRAWDQVFFRANLSGTRQLGDRWKHRLTGGGGFFWLRTAPNDETGLAPDQVAAFEDELLLDRTSVFPFVRYVGFRNRFRTFTDLGSFGQSEDVRLGVSWAAGAGFPLEALGSTEDAADLSLSAGYTAAPGGGLAQAQAIAQARYAGALLDQALALKLRAATPPFGGRLVARAVWLGRRNEERLSQVSLGGDNGLRGYPTDRFVGFGATFFRGNLEYRSPPMVWQFLHIGGVAFYDSGAIYDRLEQAVLHQSVGAGLRWVAPQMSRYVYRADLGFPLEGGFAVLFSAGSGQAVPLTGGEDDLLEPTLAATGN